MLQDKGLGGDFVINMLELPLGRELHNWGWVTLLREPTS